MAWAETGLGIGLSLVRQIVHLHGGSVEASSTGVGRAANSPCACLCCNQRR